MADIPVSGVSSAGTASEENRRRVRRSFLGPPRLQSSESSRGPQIPKPRNRTIPQESSATVTVCFLMWLIDTEGGKLPFKRFGKERDPEHEGREPSTWSALCVRNQCPDTKALQRDVSSGKWRGTYPSRKPDQRAFSDTLTFQHPQNLTLGIPSTPGLPLPALGALCTWRLGEENGRI